MRLLDKAREKGMFVHDTAFTKYGVKVRSISIQSKKGLVISTVYSTDNLDTLRENVRSMQEIVNAG
jgi:regulator of extracellular matrix RemA (YlzA/DUF370 family)